MQCDAAEKIVLLTVRTCNEATAHTWFNHLGCSLHSKVHSITQVQMGANHPNVAWPAHGNELQLLAALLSITVLQSNYMQSLQPARSTTLLCLLLALPCFLRVSGTKAQTARYQMNRGTQELKPD